MGKTHVVVIPFPAQGHVIPAMELAQRLVKQGIKVTVINIEVVHKVVTSNWSQNDGDDLLRMVSVPDGLEPCTDRNVTPKLIKSMFQHMPDKLEEFINKEDDNKVKFSCIIADFTMGWAIRVAKKMGIRGVAFCPASATTLATTLCFQRLVGDGIINNNGIPIDDKMIQLSETMAPIRSTNLWWACYEDLDMVEAVFQIIVDIIEFANRFADWIICNSTTELEPEVFNMYPKVSPIGPLLASNRFADQAGHFWQEDSTCLSWLDQQPTCSVIYIAFGSFTMFNQLQFEELAHGLELCNRPFLWVVRPDMTKETTNAYPDGYMDRVGSRGRIVSWAPQQKVLAHPSVACFMSHCGWNSTLEGVTNGVCFLCWPFNADQFLNETYICDSWKIGLGFNKDGSGIITRDEIKNKIEQLLNDKSLRAKALDMKENVASSLKSGGGSHKNLSNFIEWIKEKGTD